MNKEQVITRTLGLFLLGLGWSFTLVAGSTLLTTSVDPSIKTGAQGTSDLMMNMSAAIGGALAGVVLAVLNYMWLCAVAMVPVIIVGISPPKCTSIQTLVVNPF